MPVFQQRGHERLQHPRRVPVIGSAATDTAALDKSQFASVKSNVCVTKKLAVANQVAIRHWQAARRSVETPTLKVAVDIREP